MIDTTHIPDSITPVIGWRSWNVGDNFLLESITSTIFQAAEGWDASRILAHCHKSFPEHTAPQPHCTCGFYALPAAEAAMEMLPESLWMATHITSFDNPSALYSLAASVMGTVELTGNICSHEGGWRAQYAKVRSINYLRIFFPGAVDHQVAIDYINKLSTNYPGTVSPLLVVDLVGPDPPPGPRRTISLDDDQEEHDYIPLGFSKGEAVLRGRHWFYQLRLQDITGGRFENFERPITLFNAEYFKLQDLERERDVDRRVTAYMGWGTSQDPWMWIDWRDSGLYRPSPAARDIELTAAPPYDIPIDWAYGVSTLELPWTPLNLQQVGRILKPDKEAIDHVRPWKVQANDSCGDSGWGGHKIHFVPIMRSAPHLLDDVERFQRAILGTWNFPSLGTYTASSRSTAEERNRITLEHFASLKDYL